MIELLVETDDHRFMVIEINDHVVIASRALVDSRKGKNIQEYIKGTKIGSWSIILYNNVNMAKGGRKRLSKNEIAEIKTKLIEGVTVYALAEEYQTSKSSVYRLVKQLTEEKSQADIVYEALE